jgi:paraquat-inducible protein B
MDVGKSTQPKSDYQGLEAPPVVTMDEPGIRFKLHSEDLGSLDIGSPLYFRRLKVGQVLSYELDQNGKGVTFTVFVATPYDKYVKTNSRFWNASGIDLQMDANGLKMQTQSLVSIMVGGIAFQTLDDRGAVPDPNSIFNLFANRDEAMKNKETVSNSYMMVFRETVRGLTVGAPVDFRGVTIGEVASINLEIDAKSKDLNMLVGVTVYPERMRAKAVGALAKKQEDPPVLINHLVERGLRAQLKTGNMLTGQLYVALDFFPNTAKAKVDWAATPPQFPTTPGSMAELQATLTKLTDRIDKLPLEEMVNELRQTVKSLDTTLQSTNSAVKRVDGEVLPDVRTTLEEARKALAAARQSLANDAPLQQDMRAALRELGRAAQSLRSLTEYLEQHPESLIRGKSDGKGE